jgi:alkanesulfonate monooxygenase SsuD/methylene tetrahydromethanopterin reductase-like flavin-dependent oxidoreductase (luciferase family)
MRFAVWPTLAQPWEDVLEVSRHADATGWDGVYVMDHFMGNDPGTGVLPRGAVEVPTLEGTGALAALAVATDRVRLGTLVLGNTYRHPAVVANWAATVDHISNGRVLLGVGAGWQVNEHEQYGIGLPRPQELLARFEEACQVWHGLLREKTTTLDGRYYQLNDAICEPKPVQDPLPILIGGKGDKMLGIVAKHADEWNMWGLADTIAERGAVLDQHCERIGRDPSEIARSAQALFLVTHDAAKAKAFREETARPAVAGMADEIAEAIAKWQAIGLDEVIVPDFTLGKGQHRLDRLDLIIEQVAPMFRK